MGLPPVVVGLVVTLGLWRTGPLGALQLLFTPPAMIGAQVLVAAPLHALMLHDPRALRAVAEALSAPLSRCRR